MLTKEQKVKLKSYMRTNGLVLDDLVVELKTSRKTLCNITTLKYEKENLVYEDMIKKWYKEKTGYEL